MEREFRSGLTVQSLKATGSTTRLTALVALFMLTEVITMAAGSKIELTGKESLSTLTVLNMKEIG